MGSWSDVILALLNNGWVLYNPVDVMAMCVLINVLVLHHIGCPSLLVNVTTVIMRRPCNVQWIYSYYNIIYIYIDEIARRLGYH